MVVVDGLSQDNFGIGHWFLIVLENKQWLVAKNKTLPVHIPGGLPIFSSARAMSQISSLWFP
jgi:hypothetical protein